MAGEGSSKKCKIMLVVLAYFTVSICLVFSNKVLLSSQGATIPAPLFVTWFQCVLTALIIWVLGYVAQGADQDSFMKELPNKRPGQTQQRDTAMGGVVCALRSDVARLASSATVACHR